MGSSLVIVAIPKEDDRVWKVSSEKVPHLTLLHLGDVDQVANLEQIMLFVEHAASTTLRPFYLPVERRGELGDAKADVLFFRKGRYDFRAVRDFRTMLLKDDNVKTAYDATSQFELPAEVGAPGQPWIPHLTLGYPESPAKPIPDDYVQTFYEVCFDKVAVWLGDYEGPEFLLKDYWEEADEMLDAIPMDVAMSDIQHFGVKGMRWGVTRERANLEKAASLRKKADAASTVGSNASGGTRANAHQKKADRLNAQAEKIENKLDKKWEKDNASVQTWVKVHNASAAHFNKNIEALNNKPEYKDLNLNKEPDSPLAKKYMADVHNLSKEGLEKAANQLAPSPTGKHKVVVVHGENYGEWGLAKEKVQHAATDDVTWVKAKINAQGRVTGIEFVTTPEEEAEAAMAQTMELGADFLAHYGVKGMRWGVRREDIENAAGSSNSEFAKKIAEANRFTRDVEFEAHTRGVRDQHGIESTSKAKAEVEEKGYANFRKQDLPVIKKKPEYVKASKLRNRLLHPRDSATKAYRKEVKEAYIKRLEEAANSMTNASGTRQYTIREEGGNLPGSKYSWEVSTREVKHGAIEDHTFTVEVIMDEDGFITDLKKTDNSMAQSMDFGSVLISDLMADDEDLEHYGVKGMRWGVRNVGQRVSNASPRNSQSRISREEARREKRPAQEVVAHPTIGLTKKSKARVPTKGGEDHPPSEDAIKIAQVKAKLRKSGTAALSNKELQDLQTRLNLERNVTQLAPAGRAARGRKFLKDFSGWNKDANEFGRGALNTRNIYREARA